MSGARPFHSMTGFGSATVASGDVRVLVEIKTVNHRGLDVSLGLPDILFPLEREFRERIAAALTRGRVDIRVTIERQAAGAASAPLVDPGLAAKYAKELTALAKQLGLAPPSIGTIVGLPGVTGRRADPRETKRIGEAARRSLAQALDKLLAMRRKEGAALAADLRAKLSSIESLVGKIEAGWPAAADAVREASAVRLKALLERLGEDKKAAAARDLVAMADRGDASEEISRLRSHLVQIRETIAAGSPAGRKLDFLAQELHREASTTSAKSPSAGITAFTVALREDVERIKEQVANAE